MKELLLQIAGVNSEAEFYQMYPNQEAFFQAHPEAQEIIAQYKNQSGVEQMANGGMSNKIPVQTESYQGQPEQLVLPDGTIDSVNAKTTHENMGDNTVTDVLPEGTHIQSARNKLTPEQYEQLVSMFTPEVAKERMKQIEQVAKGKNKKISPAEISEYAKKNYQKESTPNSFDTDKLKEGNKKSYIDLSIQMNDLIKAGKELAGGTMPQQMMAWGGVVPKFDEGTPASGLQRKPVKLSDFNNELNPFSDILVQNPYAIVDYPTQKVTNPSQNLYNIDFNEYQNRVKQYEQIIPSLVSKHFKKDSKTGNYLPLDKKSTLQFQKDYDAYVDKATKMYEGKYTPEQINQLKNYIKFNNNLDPSAKLYDSKMGQFTSSRSGFQKPILPKITLDKLNKQGITHLSQALNSDLLSPEEKDLLLKESNSYEDYKMLPLLENNNNNPLPTPITPETPAQQAENIALGNVNPVNPLPQMQGRNRFNTGLLESQLARGLQGNQGYLNAAMDLNPLYVMETPDTFIRSRQNEIPTGNILYNIERAQRNTANALANQTGDWSTLASNIANAGATAMNQVGDTLTALNEKNVGLYNTTQGLQQDLLSSNVGVRNQNLTNLQNMLNYKRNLIGQKAVKDSELYSNYFKSMGENNQKEQNQKLEMLSVMASKPDMFKGQQGQDLMNSVMNTYGSYNNLFAGSPLDFGLNLFGNRRI